MGGTVHVGMEGDKIVLRVKDEDGEATAYLDDAQALSISHLLQEGIFTLKREFPFGRVRFTCPILKGIRATSPLCRVHGQAQSEVGRWTP